jgi:hypothetical protein
MFQIDGPDAVPAKPEKKPAETLPGWFDGGDPIQNKKATMVTRDWLNTVQAEIKNVIEHDGTELDRTRDDQLLKAIQSMLTAAAASIVESIPSTIPVGTVISYYGTTAPEGFLAMNGTTFSASDYPILYSLLGTVVLPDLRGCFVRGVGGKSAALGVKQQDAGRNLTGEFEGSDGMVIGQWHGCFYVEGYWGGTTTGGGGRERRVELHADHQWGADHVADEFRPLNVALLYCIKHD